MTTSTLLANSILPDVTGWRLLMFERVLPIALWTIAAVLANRFVNWSSARVTMRIDAQFKNSDSLVRSESAKHQHALIQVISWVAIAAIYLFAAYQIVKALGVPITALFRRFEAQLSAAGYIAMGGQIVDATVVAAPKQRNTEDEKRALKEGRIPEAWAAKPAKLAQKDRDARWTVKYTKARPSADGAKRVDIAIPTFGYKNHVGIDRRHGLIRTWTTTDAARHDGAQLPSLLDRANTGSGVWADTAYRSAKNEAHLEAGGFKSRIHRKKPQGKPMPKHVSRANAAKSEVRAHVEHVFARQKGPMALVIRTIGLARAKVKIGLANLVYNMRRMVWLAGPAPA